MAFRGSSPTGVAMARRVLGILDGVLSRHRTTAVLIAAYVCLFTKIWQEVATDAGAPWNQNGVELMDPKVVEPLTRSAVLARTRSGPVGVAGKKEAKRGSVLRRDIGGTLPGGTSEDAAAMLQRFLTELTQGEDARKMNGMELSRHWHALSKMHCAQGNHQEALEAEDQSRLALVSFFEESILQPIRAQDILQTQGLSHSQEADMFASLGTAQYLAGKVLDSIYSFEQAWMLDRTDADTQPVRVAVSLANLGAARLQQALLGHCPDEWRAALQTLQEAVQTARAAGAFGDHLRSLKASYANAKSLARRRGVLETCSPLGGLLSRPVCINSALDAAVAEGL